MPACDTNSKRRWWTFSASWSNIMQENGQLVAFIGGQNGHAARSAVSPEAALRSAIRRGAPLHGQRPGFPRRVRNLLYAGGYEHLVQPVAQRAHSVPHYPAERQLYSADQRIQFPAAGTRHHGGEFHWHGSSRAGAVRAAVELLGGEGSWARDHARSWLSRRERDCTCSRRT